MDLPRQYEGFSAVKGRNFTENRGEKSFCKLKATCRLEEGREEKPNPTQKKEDVVKAGLIMFKQDGKRDLNHFWEREKGGGGFTPRSECSRPCEKGSPFLGKGKRRVCGLRKEAFRRIGGGRDLFI